MVPGAAGPTGYQPSLQGIVAGAHLERGYASSVMVGVNQSRENDVVGTADLFVVWVSGLEGSVVADLFDQPVTLEHRSIGDDCAGISVVARPADDVLSPDQ